LRGKILRLVVFLTLSCIGMMGQTAATPQAANPAAPPAQFPATPQAQPPVPGAQPAAPATAPSQTLTTQQQTDQELQPLPLPQMPPTLPGVAPPQLITSGPLHRLTAQDAEALAIKNNPQISLYRLLYLASNQVTRESKSGFYPTISGNLTAVGGQNGSRIAAGALNAPRLLDRAAGGLILSQLITDFGRTNNLVATSALRAKAADMNAMATVYQIKLAVDEAFYNALQTQVEEKVAEETVRERQTVADQISTLYQNRLRSEVDLSFADVNLSQAKLLLLDAQNNYQAALSQLSQILGYSAQQQFELVDSEHELTPPPDAVSQLEDQAFSNRPEIAAQGFEYQADEHYAKAERDLLLPTVSALGVVGDAFEGSTLNGVQQFPTWYGAAGVNLSVPIFNGFNYVARWREAGIRTQAANEQLRDLKDRIANDVRTSWLNAITAYNRIGVSQQFLNQTNLALQLSQTRYNLGLSSIVELSQAQLQQTEAQIQYAAAKYQYRIAESVLRFQVAAP